MADEVTDFASAQMWSNTDFPYACLIDQRRTMAFRDAINQVVRRGDVVLDAGAGTGILSLFAAEAGAAKVYAVECDELLVRALRQTVAANELDSVIEVVPGDACDVDLPTNVDVVIAEMVETGLIDEAQVPVINSFHQRSVIGPTTKVVPNRYQTFIQLAAVRNEFYGYSVCAPIHDWPNYSKGEGWFTPEIVEHGTTLLASDVAFGDGAIHPLVKRVLEYELPDGIWCNALSITGIAWLCPDLPVRDFNAFNGRKVLPISGPALTGRGTLTVSYSMGGGLGSLSAVVGSPSATVSES